MIVRKGNRDTGLEYHDNGQKAKTSSVPDYRVSNDVLARVYHTRESCQSDACSLDDVFNRSARLRRTMTMLRIA